MLTPLDHAGQTLDALVSHTPAEDRAISDLVLRHGYGAFRPQDRKEIAKPDAVHPDPQGIWGTLLLYPKEQRDKLFPALL